MESKETNGNRTHEPNLREVTADLDGLRVVTDEKIRAARELMDERDRLYDVRFTASSTAVNAALAAQEKQTAASFAASEKAIVKAEDAQREYNVRSNEFRGQLDDQAKTLMPRPESMMMFRALEDKLGVTKAELLGRVETLVKEVAGLRESRSQGAGKREGMSASWAILLGTVALLASFIAIASTIVAMMKP